MKQWFNALETRERAVLSAGAIVAFGIVFWGFVWNPITSGRSNLETAIAQKQQLLTNLHRARAVDATTAENPSGGQSLFVLIDQTAQANDLAGAVTRARPNGPNEINVTFTNAKFDALVAWLISLNQNNGVFVDGASINSSRQRGLVSGQLFLRRR